MCKLLNSPELVMKLDIADTKDGEDPDIIFVFFILHIMLLHISPWGEGLSGVLFHVL